jgi:hypothetical protein
MIRQTIALTALLYTFSFSLIFAQDRMPLRALLDAVSQKENLTFSYDPAIIDVLYVAEDIQDERWDQVLIQLHEQYPLALTEASMGQWIIKTRPANFSFKLQSEKLPIDTTDLYAMVAVNGSIIQSEIKSDQVIFEYKPRLGDTLNFNVIGFATFDLAATELLNGLTKTLELSPLEVQLKGLVVLDYIAQGINISPSNQKVTIHTDQLPLLPGETDGDIFASISAIPGISTPDNRPGNLFIRGSSTDQTLILYENIPIYHTGHYFGTISPYNPQVVDKINISRSGFHPSLGGRVGGAVEINSEAPNSADSKFGIASNTLYASGFAKLPTKSAGVTVGARKGYPVSFKSPKLTALSNSIFDASAVKDVDGNITESLDVDFQDYQLGVYLEPNSKNTLNFTGMYTSSYTYYELDNGSDETNRTNNTGINLEWEYRPNEVVTFASNLTISDYLFNFTNVYTHTVTSPMDSLPLGDGPPPDPIPPSVREVTDKIYSVNQIFDFKWNGDLTYRLRSGNEWQTGLEYQRQNVRFNFFNLLDLPGDVIEQRIPFRASGKQNGDIYSGFINFSFNNHQRLFFQSGVRVDYYGLTKKLQASPRFFGSYDVSDHFILKTSAGKYYQFLSQVQILQYATGGFSNQLWMLADADSVGIIDGSQAMVGVLLNPGAWVLDLEMYYKQSLNVTYYSSANLRPIHRMFQGDQFYKGFDLTVKRQINEVHSLWGGYSYIDSRIMLDSIYTDELESKYAQPHIFYLGYALNRNRFKLSTGWRYASGLSTYSPEYVIATRLSEVIDDFPDRFDPVHYLSISASYQLPRSETRKSKTTFGLSIVNAYNQSNLTDQVQRVNGEILTANDRNAMQFAPNLNISIEW